MKKVIYLILIAFFATNIYSQIPQTISWQGILQDADAKNLSGTYSLTVKLFDVASGGVALWSETHSDVVIADGLVNLTLGSVTPFSVNFDDEYWLEITVASGTPLPRIKLSSVPYAMYAKIAPNEMEGVPLILKDSDGNIRMKFDPDAGTFEMLDNDTVWYSVEVNSPPVQIYHNGNGTTTIQNGEDKLVVQDITQNSVSFTYVQRNDDGSVVTSFTKYDPNTYNKEVSSITTTEKKDENGNEIVEVDEVYYDENDDDIEKERLVTTYKNGMPIKIERSEKGLKVEEWIKANDYTVSSEYKYVNGTISKEIYSDEEKTTTTTRDNGGSFSQKRIDYNIYNRTIIKNGQYGTDFQQSESDWIYRKYNSNKWLTFQPTDDSYNTGYSFTYGTGYDPTSGFVFNLNGSVNYKGTANFEENMNAAKNLNVDGDLSVSGEKNFKIDHPLDPQNKYLFHASIESNEVLNQYSGNITTDLNGFAVVTLPDYFEALNKDFRYQLTVLGEFAHAIISQKIADNKFQISTDKPNVEVSWQVTAKRNDARMIDKPFKEVREKRISE